MAAAAVQLPIPSYNRVEPGSCQLKTASYPQVTTEKDVDARNVALDWTKQFAEALNTDLSAIRQLFLAQSYWRDHLGLSWDYHTLEGPDVIISFLQNAPNGCRIKAVQVDDSNDFRKPNLGAVDFNGKIKGITSFLTLESDVGRGRGLVRLVQDASDGSWKAYTLYTAMHELKGHEETIKSRRPHGVEHGGKPGRKVRYLPFSSTWQK